MSWSPQPAQQAVPPASAQNVAALAFGSEAGKRLPGLEPGSLSPACQGGEVAAAHRVAATLAGGRPSGPRDLDGDPGDSG